MTQRLFITLGSRRRKDRILLELPGDQPVQGLIPDLVQVVGWKELAGVPRDAFFLETDEGERLPDGQTLKDAGVTSSDLLFLSHREAQPASVNPAAEKVAPSAAEVKPDAAASVAAAARAQEILKQPHLEGPRGLVFLLSQSPVTIGRSGKGGTPDIDLAEWDAKMVISRRHAVVEKSKDGISIRPEKTTNGTFINGVEVPAGESRILRDGDRIHFGFKGLELVYKAAEK
ncbi:MAG: FHA domain-containing protein [Anaerolineales bacterium]